MTWQGAPESITPVAMDSNAFFDLHSDERSERADETILAFSYVQDRIELLITPEVHNEIERQEDRMQRAHFRSMADTYPRLAAGPDKFESARQALLAGLSATPSSAQDDSDLNHVAYASAAGVTVLVTRDGPATTRLAQAAWDLLGVRVIHPSELVTLVDEAEQAPAYSPAALLGTGYSVREASADDGPLLLEFHDTRVGERKRAFRSRLLRVAARRPHSHRLIYFDPDDNAVALLCSLPEAGVLEIPVLRIRPNALQATLASQLVARLRALAVSANVSAVRVSDHSLDSLLAAALAADGYRPHKGKWIALVANCQATLEGVSRELEQAAVALTDDERGIALASFEQPAFSESSDQMPEWVASVERQARPLRIIDAPIATWLVPIRPQFASALFGYPAELYARNDELGISVEHVYYRAGRSGEEAPARILWYVSGPSQGFVIGCSELAEVVDGTPKELFRKFRRLGIYTYEQVTAAAGERGEARALRFINTEVFSHPVSLSRLTAAAQAEGQTLRLISASRINPGLFRAILSEGRRDA